VTPRAAGLALGCALVVAPARADGQVVLAWPPTRYATAELAIFRTTTGLDPLAVRVSGRGIDVVVDVPAVEAARVALPSEARCAPGIDACALTVERVSGAADVQVVLQSPDTRGAADTLLLTAHDTVRIPPPSAAGREHVVVAEANGLAGEFVEAASVITVVPVDGAARIAWRGACVGSGEAEVDLPDVLTLTCVDPGADATGAQVVSDAPVLVLSGNVVAPVPPDAPPGASGDLLLDVTPPVAGGGPVTLVVPPLPRARAAAGLGDVVRIVAQRAAMVRVRDDQGGDETRAVLPGEAWDVDTAGSPADRVLLVESDAPVAAWHLTKSRVLRGTGDPMAVRLVPRSTFTRSGRFFVPDGYGEGHALVVVREAGVAVRLDGTPVGPFVPAPAGTLEWAVVTVPPPPADAGAVHALEADGAIGAWLVGQGGYKAHGCVAVSAELDPGPAAVAVLRGTEPDQLEVVGTASGGAWCDAAVAVRLFWRVASDGAVIRVARRGEEACLAW
jgi:hypothetical protein